MTGMFMRFPCGKPLFTGMFMIFRVKQIDIYAQQMVK